MNFALILQSESMLILQYPFSVLLFNMGESQFCVELGIDLAKRINTDIFFATFSALNELLIEFYFHSSWCTFVHSNKIKHIITGSTTLTESIDVDFWWDAGDTSPSVFQHEYLSPTIKTGKLKIFG